MLRGATSKVTWMSGTYLFPPADVPGVRESGA